MINLEEKTITELKELAKEYNIKNISKLKKEELIQVLSMVIDNNNSDYEENEITKTSPITEKRNENEQELSGYKLTNEGDEIVEGILDILPDGYGFLRGENYLSSPKDVYISVVQIRRFKLDILVLIHQIFFF